MTTYHTLQIYLSALLPEREKTRKKERVEKKDEQNAGNGQVTCEHGWRIQIVIKKSLTESNTISVHREGHIREIKRPVVTMKENMVASFLCSPV